jgi:hypothetical protein
MNIDPKSQKINENPTQISKNQWTSKPNQQKPMNIDPKSQKINEHRSQIVKTQ